MFNSKKAARSWKVLYLAAVRNSAKVSFYTDRDTTGDEANTAREGMKVWSALPVAEECGKHVRSSCTSG